MPNASEARGFHLLIRFVKNFNKNLEIYRLQHTPRILKEQNSKLQVQLICISQPQLPIPAFGDASNLLCDNMKVQLP